MALSVATAIAGGAALAAYLDARFLIRNDLTSPDPQTLKQEALEYITKRFLSDRILIYHLLEERATGKEANNTFLLFEDKQWTYKQFYDALQRVGNWLINDLGIQRGEMVGLDGTNSPEYLMIWFALEAIGAIPAFINCNLTAAPLVHCVKLCEARYLLADRSLQSLIQPCESDLNAVNTQAVYYDDISVESLKDTTPLPRSRQEGHRPDEITSLIYTSGTTGMPKGTIMTRGRDVNLCRMIAGFLYLKPTDRMYTCLPLYHGAAHGLCIAPTIYAGSSVYMGRKFSHKTFWPEVCKSKANILQYVGELCRYLVNVPPSPLDKAHNVYMAWGNGMRPDVWEKFRERFNIPCIHELYAATDGLGATTNWNLGPFSRNAVAVRGLGWNLRNGSDEKRVRIDIATEEILRDQNGFAIECVAGEPGEVLHRIDPVTPDAGTPSYYRNREATVKRRMKDVFKKGDMWFRSGDMMRQDADGRVFFVDRLGDTFRWKSENVSTNEVGDVMGHWHQIDEANVYGVLVPNSDGRAGCAAIVLAANIPPEKLDCSGLAKHAISTLPRYAVPIFLRVVKALEYTGTMKLQKGRLRSEGIDFDLIDQAVKEKGVSENERDVFYWLPPMKNEYVPFGRGEWEELKAGKVRL